MVLLISTVGVKMGSDAGPLTSILAGMMPLIRSKMNEVDEKTLQTIANIMAQAFEKVSDPDISESEFAVWLKFE